MIDVDSKILNYIKHNNINAAFTLLLKHYKEKVYWHIRKMVIIHEDADDLTQDTFIKVYKHISSFNKEAKLFTWIYKIATNVTLTFLSKQKKQLSNNELKDNLMQQKESFFYTGDEIQIKLQQAINKLPTQQKLIFNMKYFEDLKYTEIAEILNVSVGSLKASYHLAVKKIENFLITN